MKIVSDIQWIHEFTCKLSPCCHCVFFFVLFFFLLNIYIFILKIIWNFQSMYIYISWFSHFYFSFYMFMCVCVFMLLLYFKFKKINLFSYWISEHEAIVKISEFVRLHHLFIYFEYLNMFIVFGLQCTFRKCGLACMCQNKTCSFQQLPHCFFFSILFFLHFPFCYFLFLIKFPFSCLHFAIKELMY